jgi:predicted nucleic acid-binding protein
MKIFVDTNIFLDLILKRDDYGNALLLFNAIEKRFFSAVVADITILNIDYIAKKQVKDVKDFLSIINSNFQIVGASNKEITQALDITNSDLEDNLQYVLAKESSCSVIITNDKLFYTDNIETLRADEFLEKYLQNGD